jgi:hypothetical protein
MLTQLIQRATLDIAKHLILSALLGVLAEHG